MGEEAATGKRPHIIRRLYDWVLHWAETPYGAWALFVLAFAESSFFPIPPDVLLIALAISVPLKSFRYAAIATVGSLLGGAAGYGIGWGLWTALGDPPHPLIDGGALLFKYIPGFKPKTFIWVRSVYQDWKALAVFGFAFTPLPYKVVTVTAGVCKIDFGLFLLFSLLGRAGRFFLVAALIRKYRKPVRRFIEKYLGWLTLAFFVLLIAGFVVIRYWGTIGAWLKGIF